jgi:hypothetical protein
MSSEASRLALGGGEMPEKAKLIILLVDDDPHFAFLLQSVP